MTDYGRIFTGYTLGDLKRFVDEILEIDTNKGPFTEFKVDVGPLGQIYWWGRIDDVLPGMRSPDGSLHRMQNGRADGD